MSNAVESRCQAALARLGVKPSQRLTVLVLNNVRPGAYAYPSGKLYVTSGLMEIATDDELAAALAHELGHLYDRGHLEPPFALAGGGLHRDLESRADAWATKLLACREVPTSALASLLEKIRQHPQTAAEVREDLSRRLRVLDETAR